MRKKGPIENKTEKGHKNTFLCNNFQNERFELIHLDDFFLKCHTTSPSSQNLELNLR